MQSVTNNYSMTFDKSYSDNPVQCTGLSEYYQLVPLTFPRITEFTFRLILRRF